MFTKPKTFGILLFALILLLGLTISARADDEFPPSVEPSVVRSVDNPLTVTAPLALSGTFDLSSTDTALDLVITPNVIGGTPSATQYEFPWMVSQQWYGANFCGGTLIDEDWVLTAAHCWITEIGVPPYYAVILPTDEKMVLGEYSISGISGHEQVIDPLEVYIHPDFDPEYLAYDIALIKLATPATLNTYVSTIALTDSVYTNEVLSNYDGVVTGWGAIGYDDKNDEYIYPDVLQKATVDFLADSACSYYGASYQPESMLCAGIYPEGTKDTCYGDSGGPIAFQKYGTWLQAGVTSWGNECAQEYFPGVYARVSAALAWISSVDGGTLSTPTNLSPSAGETVNTINPELSWDAMFEEPQFYEVVIKNSTNQVVYSDILDAPDICNETTCAFTAQNLPEDDYTWNLRAYKPLWGYSAKSFASFTIRITITPIYPNNGIWVAMPRTTFRWEDVGWAQSYKIKVIRTTPSSTTTFYMGAWAATYCSDGLCEFKPNVDFTFGQYEWFLSAYNPSTGYTEYPETGWIVNVNTRPPLIAPAPQAILTDSTPTLEWRERLWPWTYEVKVLDKDTKVLVRSFVVKRIDVCVDTVCSLDVTPALAAGDYIWQVRGSSPTYGTGAWNMLSFTIAP